MILGALYGLSLFLMLGCIIGVVCYVLYAIPLYQMATRAGLANAWLAWIPIAQCYILCQLARNEIVLFGQIRFSKRENAFWALIVLALCSYVLGKIPFLGALLALLIRIAMVILMWKFNYDVLRTYKHDTTDVMALSIIGTIIGIVMIVELWMLRNNDPDYSYTE